MKRLCIFIFIFIIYFLVQPSGISQNVEVEGSTYLTGELGIETSIQEQKIDARGINTDDGALLLLGNSDLSHRLLFFSGRSGDQFPFIQWKEGDPLRFATDEAGFSEKFSIATDGLITAQNRITNVTDPSHAQDAATKNYVDQMAEMMLDAGLNGIVKDIDGNVYKTIKISSQVWMAQNLKTTRYNDGTAIPEVTDGTAWANLTTPGYSWYDNDSATNAKLYGAIYNYYAVADTNSLNVCPIGWHVPTDAEWTVLTDFLEENGYGYEGSGIDIGKSMASTFIWDNSSQIGDVGNDSGSNNSSGFAGLPGGYRYLLGGFFKIGQEGYWWSSTDSSGCNAWHRVLHFNVDFIYRSYFEKWLGFSVRCLRD